MRGCRSAGETPSHTPAASYFEHCQRAFRGLSAARLSSPVAPDDAEMKQKIKNKKSSRRRCVSRGACSEDDQSWQRFDERLHALSWRPIKSALTSPLFQCTDRCKAINAEDRQPPFFSDRAPVFTPRLIPRWRLGRRHGNAILFKEAQMRGINMNNE